MQLWKLGTTDFLSPTHYDDDDKYTAIGNFTVAVVQNDDVYFCGAPDIGFNGFSVTVKLYDLPRFQTSNKPQVSDSQSDQLTVTWNKWTTDDIGEGPVESYKVYYRESGESDWISGQVISVSDSSQMSYTSTITGLQWSTQYEITVTVKRPGPLGEGSKDTTITETTLCATPQKPTIQNVLSPELKQLEVHVQVPDSSDIKCKKDGVDGYIDYIEVKYRKTGTEDEYEMGKIEVYEEIVTGTKVITFTEESLLPYTEYEVVALLKNADATSPQSNSVTVVSHEDVPSKPRNVTLQPAVHTITVTWLEPEPPNGILTAYKIIYWKSNDENDKIDILVDIGDLNEHSIDNLEYNVLYTIQVSAFTSVGEGEYSDKLSIQTTEAIPHEPASIDVQRTTENSIKFTWTDPDIFSGDILHYGITYRSSESVHSSTVLESKDLLVEGSAHTHTLEGLPPGTQFEISVNASTSKGFGDPRTVSTGTKIGVGVSDILEEFDEKSELNLTDHTATIDLRKPKSNSDIKTDTQLMSYILVVEEVSQKRKRDLEENQYITASFPLNEIPDQLIVGNDKEYNGYINKPLTPGQEYVIYDGIAVYTTGVEELLLTDQPISSFQGGVPNIIEPGGSAVGVAVGVVVVLLIVVAIIVAVFIMRRRLGNQKRSTEYETPNSSMPFENAYANLEESSMNSDTVTDKETGESQYMNITEAKKAPDVVKPDKPIKPTKVPTSEPAAKPRSLPPKPKPKAKPIHNSQYTIQVKDLADYVIKKREENDFVSQFKGHMSVPSAGIGRTGSFISIDSMLKMANAEGCIDVFNFVKRGRENRMNFVQTAEQYEFVHTAVMEAILCGDTSIPASDFRQIYGKLQTIDRKTKKSQLQVQWENLGKVSRKPRDDECDVGTLEENSDKNRFHNVLPFNRHRIRLMTPIYEDEFSTDYINASFVSAYTVKDAFLVTQMPLPNTIVDLWRMQQQTGNGPVTVHCINGIGRSGVYCASVSTCDRIKVDQMVDVFQAVKTLRTNRPYMVEST
ncbi:receptor-type tyrosine-protein phosphatase T-like, partial [Saccoglossus kowalevskii]